MRQLLIILLIGQSLAVWGQSIPTGNFYTKKGNQVFETELFQFNSDKTFKYLMFGCVENALGQGRYEIENDTLTLNFEQHPMKRQTERIEFNEGKSDKTTINIEAKILESESGFRGINCYLKNLQKGTVTDSTGYAQLVINRLITTDTLIISFIGYRHVQIPIKPTYDNINVLATLDNLYFYDEGDKEKFKINWTKKNSFGLQRFENLEVPYQKISNKKSNELITKIR